MFEPASENMTALDIFVFVASASVRACTVRIGYRSYITIITELNGNECSDWTT